MRSYAAAISQHPDAALATGEIVGQVLDRLGPDPDLAVIFVSRDHADVAEEIAATIDGMLGARAIIGATAGSVIGGSRELEDTPALALWAASGIGPVQSRHLAVRRTDEGTASITGLDGHNGGTLVLLADPFTFPIDAFLRAVAADTVPLQVIGGLVAASGTPVGNRLIVGPTVHRDGAAAVLLPPGVVAPVVSQGCRPLGQPFVVTRSDGNVIHELGGMAAGDRLRELIDVSGAEDRELLRQGLLVGVVVDERKLDFVRGDFLIRAVVGADATTGSLTIGERVEVGTTLQFHVRDAVTADEDLRALLRNRRGEAALLFTCNGRGSRLFDHADHDANLLAGAIDGGPLAGMSCAGEIGPVGARSHVHGFTAAMALFGD